MSSATLIYPHQLYPTTFAGFSTQNPVYLVEESLFLTEFPTHAQKLLLHRLTLQAYKLELEAAGFTVVYLDVRAYPSTEAVFKKLAEDGVSEIHCADTTDDWLEQRIELYCVRNKMTRTIYPSELFILKSDFAERYKKSGRFMARFYKALRQDYKILLEIDGTPQGGKWSFDDENRQKVPKNSPLPEDIVFLQDENIEAAKSWLTELPGERYGETNVWIPYTRTAAKAFLTDFLTTRFAQFGPYEDALVTNHARLFHSALSPLLNIGLLNPTDVINEAILYAQKNDVPINSLEGFVRQILGWREFIRAAYHVDGRKMRSTNFFKHERSLPSSFWTGTTDLFPIDTAIAKALKYGYNHHIDRLMVLGNFMLLSKTNPEEVYRWFMAMYVDAYDWVMVPNVYGMSQFADGGLFATKPYISGGNYLKKMSDFPTGNWEEVWTSLYWNFIYDQQNFFLKNHRLSMMPRLLAKMAEEKRNAYLNTAKDYLTK